MNLRGKRQQHRIKLLACRTVMILIPVIALLPGIAGLQADAAAYSSSRQASPASAGGSHVLQTYRMDITGDGVPETIRITGTLSEANRESFTKLSLEIQDGSEPKQSYFQIGSGFAPLLRICDWNGDRINDLHLTVFDPEDHRLPVYAIYTFTGGGPSRFTQQPLPDPLAITGKLKDNYKVQIRLRTANQTHMLDLRDRRAAYDHAGYYQNGRLLRPKTVEAAFKFGELVPVDADKDGSCELRGVQRIGGIASDDVIAYAVSVWKWRYGQWTLLQTELLPSPAQPSV